MRIALYQPDIPQNTGTILRLGACLGVPLDIIEPCGFVLSEARFRRAAMDYLDHADWCRHSSWERYLQAGSPGRLVLLTTRAETVLPQFSFKPDDRLLLGRETAGVPEAVHDLADARLRIPMQAGLRSLNVAIAAALMLGEALRQTGGWPDGRAPAPAGSTS